MGFVAPQTRCWHTRKPSLASSCNLACTISFTNANTAIGFAWPAGLEHAANRQQIEVTNQVSLLTWLHMYICLATPCWSSCCAQQQLLWPASSQQVVGYKNLLLIRIIWCHYNQYKSSALYVVSSHEVQHELHSCASSTCSQKRQGHNKL